MGYADDIADALYQLRAAAEAGMVDTCRVTRKGSPTTNPTTGEVATPETTVYEGRAKRQTYEAHETTREVGGHTTTIQRYSAHFPVASFIPAVGDEILWLTSEHDPDLPGTRDRIAGLFNKSFATAQRVYVDELSTRAPADTEESSSSSGDSFESSSSSGDSFESSS